MPESGRITATVDVIDVSHLDYVADGSVKVRLVIWSGQDFRFPHVKRGAIFADADAAQAAADELAQALDVLGIPIEEREPAGDARLPAVGEGEEYPYVG